MYRSYNAADEITARSRGNFHSNFRPGIDAECRMIKVETVAEWSPPFRPVPRPVDRRFVGGNRTIAGSRLESFARTVKIRERERDGEKSGPEWIQGLTWPLFTREPSGTVYQRLEMKSFFRANESRRRRFFPRSRDFAIEPIHSLPPSPFFSRSMENHLLI